MNYSIILTEISFSPGTSILLQIITNNSYDISDESELDREGGQFAYSVSESFPKSLGEASRQPLAPSPSLPRKRVGTNGFTKLRLID